MYPFVTLVVAASEAAVYRKSGNRVVECPDQVQGNVSRVRNWILDQNQDARCVVIMDDDYWYLGRWESGWQMKLDVPRALHLLSYGTLLAEDARTTLWGVNMIYDKLAYRENVPFSFKAPVLGPLQGHLPNAIRYDEDLPLKEDYDMFLQHMALERRVLRLNMYHYHTDQHQATGGVSEVRNMEREQQQFKALVDKWGSDIVHTDKGQTGATQRKANRPEWDINPIIRVPIGGI